MKTLRICTALIAVAALQSCQPEAPEIPDPLIGKWRLVAMEEKTGGVWEDTYDDLDACEKDNFLKFGADKSFSMDEGPTKCDATDPQRTALGGWERVGADGLKTTGLDADEFRIVALTGDELRLEVINNPTEEARLRFTKLP